VSEFYMPTFRTLCPAIFVPAFEDGTSRVFRKFGIQNFKRLGINQEKANNIQNTAKFEINNVNESFKCINCVDSSYFPLSII